MSCAQTVDIGACSADGPNSTANNSNYVVQYPKQYRRTDGKWLAMGSLIGSLIGVLSDRDIIKKANEKEKDWEDLTDRFRDKGLWLFGEHADKLVACLDKMHEKLCQLVECGYKPDYNAMLVRTRASAMATVELERKKLCRISGRYHTGLNADVLRALSLAEVQAVTTAMSTAIDNARKTAFELNYKMLYETANLMESHHLGRINAGANYMGNAVNSYKLLAESLRATAKASMSDWGKLGGTLASLLPLFIAGFNDPENDCEGNDSSAGAKATSLASAISSFKNSLGIN